MKGFVMRTINRSLSVAAAVSLAAITGCAAQGGGSAVPPPVTSSAAPTTGGAVQAAEAVITIRDFKYVGPASVKPGAKVTVTNADRAPHTLTAKDVGGFDIEVPASGTRTLKAPEAPGEYAIICSFHPQMTGTLVVE